MIRPRLAAVALAVVAGATLTAVARDDGESLLAEGARVEKLADGFGFTEGPAAHPSGDVYFSDIRNDRIHRWSAAGALTLLPSAFEASLWLRSRGGGEQAAASPGEEQMSEDRPSCSRVRKP